MRFMVSFFKYLDKNLRVLGMVEHHGKIKFVDFKRK